MKGNLTKIIIQALIGGVICWFAFAFGTCLFQKGASFAKALGNPQGILMGAFGMIGCFLGYWNKSRQ